MLHLYIMTVFFTFLWVGFYTLIGWAIKKMFWDSWLKSRREAGERARRIADRRG